MENDGNPADNHCVLLMEFAYWRAFVKVKVKPKPTFTIVRSWDAQGIINRRNLASPARENMVANSHAQAELSSPRATTDLSDPEDCGGRLQ